MNPTTKQPCPLGDAHCNALDQVIVRNGNAIRLAQDCIDCGLDVSDQKAALEAQHQLATALKRKFFPNRP